jgi:YggT family protein
MFQLIGLILWALDILQILIVVQAILSWIPSARGHPAARLLDSIVEPILRPIREVLRPYMRNVPVDISPMVAIFLIWIAQAVLRSVALSIARPMVF